MHQLRADEFSDPPPGLAQDENHGYGVYATYALEVIDRLLKKADQRFSELARQEVGFPYLVHQTLRIHRVSDARKLLIKCINRSMGSPFRMSDGEEFRFRKDATREGARFNIWEIKKGQFKDAFGSTSAGEGSHSDAAKTSIARAGNDAESAAGPELWRSRVF